MKVPTWTETASADNATATASHAAQTGSIHTIVYVLASYGDSTKSGLLTIKRATTAAAVHYIHGADIIPIELRGNLGEAVSAELAASGTGGTLGKVSLIGFTE